MFDRFQKLLDENPLAEAILDLDPRPKLALDRHGALLWASERAENLLNLRRGSGKKALPDIVIETARRLGSLSGRNSLRGPLPTSITVPCGKASPIAAEMRLARLRTGDSFILVELEDPGVPPRLEEIGARHHLTSAETQVLHLVSLGLSNQEIGKRLSVSKTTVHSHMTRIFSKLRVRSRAQAALAAHGLRIGSEPDGE